MVCASVRGDDPLVFASGLSSRIDAIILCNATVSALFTGVALGPVTSQTNGTGSQLTTVNIKVVIVLKNIYTIGNYTI